MVSTLMLALEAHQHGSSVLYRLQQGVHLHFRLGASLLGCHIDVYTNHQKEYKRDKYVKLEWSESGGDATAAFAAIDIVRSGSFHFYFLSHKEDVGGDGYFVVDPVLRFNPQLPPLPLDCIQCQTVVAKNLGNFKTWEDKLRVTHKSGYNMAHFTPIQALGASNSAYSIRSQLDLNPVFETNWPSLTSFISTMRSDWHVLSICDVVLNHTANETEWIYTHSEATYNAFNSPHLRPAVLLDRVIYHLSADIENGKWVDRGLKRGKLDSEDQLQVVKSLLYDHYYPQVNFFEFFLADVADILKNFEKLLLTNSDAEALHTPEADPKLLKLQVDPQYRRLKATVNLNLALKVFNLHHPECRTEEQRILKCCSELKRHLDQLNHEAYNQTWAHLHAATDNILAGARYNRLDQNGPKIMECSTKEPVSHYYFLSPKDNVKSLKEEEKLIYDGEKSKLFMAHNGWVMNWDSRINFALAPSNVYLRRELVVWGDSVKLRYGDKPEDVPFLWKLMREYVEQVAQVFDGIRLDNCHSTPIHVAEYLLDAARLVKPNLYVIAELFTTTEHTDNLFINRLGINSMIRESLTAWDSHEQGRLVHRFGGLPVGSFLQMTTRPLVPSIAHAIFFDQTHDNESFFEKRTAYDQIPTAAMVNLTACATGSTRGYDELVPHMIHVVNEPRTYASWGDQLSDMGQGIIGVKEALNRLHYYLGSEGFSELYVDQMDPDIVAVTRHNALTHESIVGVAHTVFNKHVDVNQVRHAKPVRVQGDLVKIILEAKLEQVHPSKKFEKNEKFVNGDHYNFKSYFKENIMVTDSKMCSISDVDNDNYTTVQLHNFGPGSVIVFHFKLPKIPSDNANKLNNLIKDLEEDKCDDLKVIISKLDLLDMNFILFRCNEEEMEDKQGGCYTLDTYGPLKYAGLQGFMSLLNDIRAANDLGNWLPTNLRNGNWAMDYIISRLGRRQSTKELGSWIDRKAFSKIKALPRFLVPRYFDAIVTRVFQALLQHTWSKMSLFIRQGSAFVKALALGSIQHVAISTSARLPDLSPSLIPRIQDLPTLAAGLPHFSTGYMRSWGRDTFIALRGMLLIPGRYEEARAIILGYAATLRHGLIPNLLDGGRNARYNCRDATWWWLYALLAYVQETDGGEAILKDKVSRLYPKDDDEMKAVGQVEQNLEEVVYEALQRHFQGLKFRERNAGYRIDEHMRDEGFNNSIGVDLQTGFVYGGNIHNCGTWMDKMGSSAKAGNKGNPTTPRDGSAVEIVGLSYACLRQLSTLHACGHFSFKSVSRSSPDMEWSFDEWSDCIKANFEPHFFINSKMEPSKEEKRADLINVEHIYKDTLNSGNAWCDYQLRCNFPIAMAVAPDLFDPNRAWEALQIVRNRLMGKLGIATLDPKDWAYRGYYDNGNDSHDPTVAHGANYHQGPEWVWPVGFFLKAYIVFAKKLNRESEAIDYIMATLSNHFEEVQQSHWKGIPELTNAKGNFCPGSNPIQAWSMSCLLEVLHDM